MIVGSGFNRLAMKVLARQVVATPFGEPSSPLLTVELGTARAVCLARHGEGHAIAPHEVNYRANIWALHQAGVRQCIGINAVGTIAAGFVPGQLAVPEQLIDYTYGRDSSFGAENGQVVHVEFSEPFDPVLRGRLATAAADCGYAVPGGIYGVTQGPRLETASEIDRLERDGCAMVGMTAMPEAVLARELGMRYAVCALGVNYAAGRSRDGGSIHGQIETYLDSAMGRLAALLARLIPELADLAV
jgi:purine nucleoside phosphorylase